ncbi:hypothetical protein GCM10011494_26470 [Novosphingobium endophyticum]|uniref:Uncharacterized protein n=1 Tax=Novosphingobium endophyticum TaxID=1955250 RepID=A0A916TUB7_9SPHN|nr:hypothetical protein GCM10011494_26470 [Novosphingobium endophyticum]
MSRENASIACSEVSEAISAIPTERLISGDALCEEQTFDPVDMLGALDDQHLALAADATPIFLLDAGWPDHSADAWFASLVGEQSTDQRFAIDLVRLRTSASAGCGDRRRVNDMALDTFVLQDPVDPETIETRLLDDDKPEFLSGSRLRLRTKLGEALHQPGNIASADNMLRHPLAGAWRQRRDQQR